MSADSNPFARAGLDATRGSQHLRAAWDGLPDGSLWGTATWSCPYCHNEDGDELEWTGAAVEVPGQLDPAAYEDGDRCPGCGEHSDQVLDFAVADEQPPGWRF